MNLYSVPGEVSPAQLPSISRLSSDLQVKPLPAAWLLFSLILAACLFHVLLNTGDRQHDVGVAESFVLLYITVHN